MKNSFFRFKKFEVRQENTAMKVTTDGCLFGAWVANELKNITVPAILDIGAGTGLLSLMIAQQSAAMFDAVELEDGAAKQAAENFLNSPWADRLKLIHDDILAGTINRKYEVIISNPPFYEHELASSSNSKNIAHHGEGLTLDQLPGIIKKYLDINGRFYFLLPFKRMKEILGLFHKNGLNITQLILVKQTVDHDPFRFMLEGSFHQTKDYTQSELSITNEHREYTPEFISLLKDYYLYL
jgi:tRNA1Val (adenine37-N6)-methyltransferase